jgi:hypothetical protein
MPRAALALAGAGFHSLTNLEGVTREELLAISGVGHRTLAVLDQLRGQPLPGKSAPTHFPPPWPDMVWRQRGLPAEAAITFAQMRMTLRRLESMTREELLSLRGVGPGTLQACELILGRQIPSNRPTDPVEAGWRSQGIPARAARALRGANIRSPEDLQKVSREDLAALRGLGEKMIAGSRRSWDAGFPAEPNTGSAAVFP